MPHRMVGFGQLLFVVALVAPIVVAPDQTAFAGPCGEEGGSEALGIDVDGAHIHALAAFVEFADQKLVGHICSGDDPWAPGELPEWAPYFLRDTATSGDAADSSLTNFYALMSTTNGTARHRLTGGFYPNLIQLGDIAAYGGESGGGLGQAVHDAIDVMDDDTLFSFAAFDSSGPDGTGGPDGTVDFLVLQVVSGLQRRRSERSHGRGHLIARYR